MNIPILSEGEVLNLPRDRITMVSDSVEIVWGGTIYSSCVIEFENIGKYLLLAKDGEYVGLRELRDV